MVSPVHYLNAFTSSPCKHGFSVICKTALKVHIVVRHIGDRDRFIVCGVNALLESPDMITNVGVHCVSVWSA